MNKCFFMGRLTRDPEVRTTEQGMKVARFSLAVDRYTKNGNATDFLNFISFDKKADFVEKYCRKGAKFLITGRIQTGSYTNKDGLKVYTTDVVVEDIEFTEKKETTAKGFDAINAPIETEGGGFMNIPEGLEDELPFN